MIKFVKNVLKCFGIFKITDVKDEKEQEEYSKVVIIVGAVVSAAILLTKLLII